MDFIGGGRQTPSTGASGLLTRPLWRAMMKVEKVKQHLEMEKLTKKQVARARTDARIAARAAAGMKPLGYKRTHGLSKTPEYSAWVDMRKRCSENYRGRRNYFDRGIYVDLTWLGQDGLLRFLEHVGPRPGSGYSLDRINNDGPYAPGNVRWADRIMQEANKARLRNSTDAELAKEVRRRGLDRILSICRTLTE